MPREVAERRDAIAAVAEVFREHGYAGSSLATITQQTGLVKGSLYHFFPNGKQEMAEAGAPAVGGQGVTQIGPTVIVRLLNWPVRPGAVTAAVAVGFSLTVALYLAPDTPGDFAERAVPFVLGFLILLLGKRRGLMR